MIFRISINGIVQGIGFRPFVYRLAHESGLKGYVLNSSSGVEILIRSSRKQLADFVSRLRTEHPPGALIKDLNVDEVSGNLDLPGFRIKQSRQEKGTTLVSPDLAICPDCLRELSDPDDPRYQYSFINCTNCGPRYSIISDLPYDRPLTSMKDFALCSFCREEYEDPLNRRFHAQPVACKTCGPRLMLVDGDLKELTADPLATAKKLLREGHLVGIKGIGGFHIACDPGNDEVLSRLRILKSRPHKPFAVMCHPDFLEEIVRTEPDQLLLLRSPGAPILILPARKNSLSPLVAPDQPNLGVFLPYAPHHYQLLDRDLPCLVMTSGNCKDGPIAISETNLKGLCDYYLTHNRPILNRSDDSIILPVEPEKHILVRRSRGYVPRPLKLNFDTTPALGCGAQLKLTFSLTRDRHLFTSPYIGNSDTKENFDFYLECLDGYKKWFGVKPEVAACDLQPDFMSTKFAEELGLPLFRIQHHHAHIAAVMAESGIEEPVIGIAYDGTGYGADGAIWGGEIMYADLSSFKRLFHLDYMPLPGGDSAIRHPVRIAFSYLKETGGEEVEFEGMSPGERRVISRQMDKGFNVFKTSSMGRLFDCVSAMLGLYPQITYEAQSAIALENLCADINPDQIDAYDYLIEKDIIDIKPLIESVYKDIKSGTHGPEVAAKFHKTVVDFSLDAVSRAVTATGVRKIVLCGGVMQNRILIRELSKELTTKGLSVFLPRELPVNDGSISAGQAIIANKRIRES